MARKRKYGSEEEIKAAYHAPDGHEEPAAKRRRMKNLSAALIRFRKQQSEARGQENADSIPAVVSALQAVEIGLGQNVRVVSTSTAVTESSRPASTDFAVGIESATNNRPALRRSPTARRSRANMTPSQLARVRAADAERKRRARANRSESQIDRDRQQDAQRARARRALMNHGEVEQLRETNRVSDSNQRGELSSEQRELQRYQDAEAHRERREGMSSEEWQAMRDEDAATRRATRDAMTEEGRQAMRDEDAAARRATRECMAEDDRQTMRDEDAAARRATRETMSEEGRRDIREQDAEMHRVRRERMAEEERQSERDQNAAARRAARDAMTEEEQQATRDRATAARQAIRDAMTEEELGRRREAERFRRRSRKYQKGLAYYEEFDPAIIPGGRHYFSRYTDDTLERVCQHCGAWKFPDETEGSCCRKGLVNVPPPREAPAELNRLFGNPRFKQSIRAYNNVFAFTSMGSSRTRSLNVDERVTRSGVYNFRVQGSVLFAIAWEHCYRHSTADRCLRKYTLMIQIWKHA